MNKLHVLLVDDDDQFAMDFNLLGQKLFEINRVENGEQAIAFLEKHLPDAILLDLQLGAGMDGLETLQKIRHNFFDIPVIMITEYAHVESAVKAIKLGALHYMAKNPNMKELQAIIERELQHIRWKKLYQQKYQSLEKIVGSSKAMKKLRRIISRLALSDSNVVIEGESGVGKELVAQALYQKSNRAEMPLVAVDCGAITASLFESEFFGHERGAFTDAKFQKKGKLELADGGTVFLDEITNLDLSLQVKLLRALESQSFTRVGGEKYIQTDIRVIAATNKNLLQHVEQGLFREDLFYRLSVVTIKVPPLRDHKEDIAELVTHFCAMRSDDCGEQLKLSSSAMQKLKNYSWPGNVRELRNMIERLFAMFPGENVEASDIQFERTLKEMPDVLSKAMNLPYAKAGKQVLSDFKSTYLRELLDRNNWNISQAAREAEIPRPSLHRMIRELDLKS